MNRACRCVFLVLAMAAIGLARASAARAQGYASQEIMRLQSGYDNAIKALDRQMTNWTESLNDQYIKRLTALETKTREAGKLEPLLAIKKERERFVSERQILDKDLAADIPELRNAQEDYLKALAKLPVERAKGVLAEARKLDRELASVQETLTKNNRIDDAVEIKKTRESLKDRPEISVAEFALAEAETNKTEKQPSTEEAVPAAKATTAAQEPKKAEKPSAAPKKKYTGSTENYIKRRYNKLCKLIEKQDWSAAVEYVNPDFVKKAGPDVVKKHFRIAFQYLRMTDNPRVKLDAGEAKVDDKEQTATLAPKVWFNNTWHEQPALCWIQVDGEWYLDFEEEFARAAGEIAPPGAPKPWQRKARAEKEEKR